MVSFLFSLSYCPTQTPPLLTTPRRAPPEVHVPPEVHEQSVQIVVTPKGASVFGGEHEEKKQVGNWAKDSLAEVSTILLLPVLATARAPELG